MTQIYQTKITTYGEQQIAKALATNTPLQFSTMAVGDGNGSATMPSANQTALVHEVYRSSNVDSYANDTNSKQAIFELLIPESEGGFWVREIGLFDQYGKLVAVANCPDTFKSVMTAGSGKVNIFRLVLAVTSSEAVEIIIDNSVVYLTREAFNQFKLNLAKPDGFKYIGQCESIEELRTIEPTQDQQRILVKSYHVNLNKGGGTFYADLGDTTTVDNGGTVIVTNGGKRWLRIHTQAVVEEFGAVADKVNDDTDAFLRAADYAKAKKLPFVAQGKYKLTQAIDVRELAVDMHDCDILLDGDGQLIIGGNGNSSYNPNQEIGRILYGKIKVDPASYSRPSIKCIGSKGQTISIKYTDYFQMWMSTDPATYPRDASQAYSTFNLNFVVKLEFATDPRFDNAVNVDGAGSANQWCNENIFNLNRCFALIIGGSYRHNCNYFVGGSFEGAKSYIDIQSGNKNRFVNTRLEGVSSVRFGENTEGNILERSYFGSTSGMILNVEDLGVMNRIETATIIQSTKQRVLDVNPFTPKYNNRLPPYNYLQVAKTIRATVNYGLLADSGWFEFTGKQDVLYFDFDNSESRYQVRIFVKDSKGKDIIYQDARISSGLLKGYQDRFAGTARGGIPYGMHRFLLLEDGKFWVRIEISASDDYKKGNSKYLHVDLYSKRNSSIMRNMQIHCVKKPTQYIGFKGDVVHYQSGTITVTEHFQAKILTLGETITINNIPSGSNVKVGDSVGIESDNGEVAWSFVTAVDDTQITLQDPLPDWVAVGDVVYVSRLETVSNEETLLWQGSSSVAVTVTVPKLSGIMYVLMTNRAKDIWYSVPVAQSNNTFVGSSEFGGENADKNYSSYLSINRSGSLVTVTPQPSSDRDAVFIKKIMWIGG